VVARSDQSSREGEKRRVSDADHDQHSETRRPRDHDRIATTGQPFPVRRSQICRWRDVGQKNRCWATVAELIGDTSGAARLRGSGRLLTRDQPAWSGPERPEILRRAVAPRPRNRGVDVSKRAACTSNRERG